MHRLSSHNLCVAVLWQPCVFRLLGVTYLFFAVLMTVWDENMVGLNFWGKIASFDVIMAQIKKRETNQSKQNVLIFLKPRRRLVYFSCPDPQQWAHATREWAKRFWSETLLKVYVAASFLTLQLSQLGLNLQKLAYPLFLAEHNCVSTTLSLSCVRAFLFKQQHTWLCFKVSYLSYDPYPENTSLSPVNVNLSQTL